MLRLGVIGHGNRVAGFLNVNMRKIDPDLKVVGIVDPNQKEAAERLPESDRGDVVFYDNVESLMRGGKVDGVFVGTRCDLHTPYAQELAKYDVPIFLEKPVATTMAQATALEKAFEKAKVPVIVSFPLRVSPLCEMVKRLLGEGAVGRCEHILADNYVGYGTCYYDMFYRNFAVTQGLFLQKATHDFDYMSYLMNSAIVRIGAMANYGRVFGGDKPAGLMCSSCGEAESCLESPANRRRNQSGGRSDDHPCLFGVDCGSAKGGQMNEDCSSALLEFADGTHGVYTQVFFTRRDAERRGATISGYQGTVNFDWYRNDIRRVRHHQPFSDIIQAGAGLGHFGGDMELAYNFIKVIQGKEKTRTPIEAGLQSVYACLAAKESAETGQFVKVRQVGQVR